MITPKLTFVYDRKKMAGRTRTAPVELRITCNGVRKYISTGIQLLPKEWSNGCVTGRTDWKELNAQLQLLHRRCSEIIVAMMEGDGLDLQAIPKLLNERLVRQETFMEYAKDLAEKRYSRLSAGTKRNYGVFFRFFEGWRGIVSFADVNEKNIMKMDDALAKKGLKADSRWNYHKILKLFIQQALDDGLIKQNPYKKLDIKKSTTNGLVRYLTPDEFHRFEQCEIDDACMKRVRDLFVFQTYTMMGYSDLAEFDMRNCTKINGAIVYKAKRQKTKQDFTIVLIKPALKILKAYKNKLPIISNVKYNLYLKAAVKYAKIKKPVSTHWARHTGATLMLNEGGVPMHIVQHMLGHASIRETEKTYAKVLDRTIVETMANYQTLHFSKTQSEKTQS